MISKTLSPTLSDLIRNVAEGIVEPSASTYVFNPVKSASASVPVRHKVDTTSWSYLTSLAPLSIDEFSRRILPFIA